MLVFEKLEQFQFVEVKQLNTSYNIAVHETVNQIGLLFFLLLKIRKRGKEKMKNIDKKILMAEEEIKQLQNKRKKLISQQKQEERKKRDRRLYKKGAVFESIFTESKDFTKDEFYQLITFPNIKEVIHQKIKKIMAMREESGNQNTEMKEEETDIEE